MLDHPYYLRLTTENDAPYFQRPSAAETVISTLVQIQRQGWLRLHGFVLLPNVLEVVASLLRQRPAGTVAHFQAESIPPLCVLVNSANMIWNTQYQCSELTSQRALDARLEILLLLPVAAQITETAAEYPYSSANPRYQSCVSIYAGFRMARDTDHQPDKHPTEETTAVAAETVAEPDSSEVDDEELEGKTRLIPPVSRSLDSGDQSGGMDVSPQVPPAADGVL
jgi:hypothetical protein